MPVEMPQPFAAGAGVASEASVGELTSRGADDADDLLRQSDRDRDRVQLKTFTFGAVLRQFLIFTNSIPQRESIPLLYMNGITLNTAQIA